MQSTRAPTPLDWLMVVLLALIWGCSFIMIKYAVRVFDPIQMSMWRMVVSTVIYVPLAAIYWRRVDWSRWKALAVVAFFGSAIPNFFFAAAQRHVGSSLAGILNSLTPLFTLVLGALFFKLEFSRNKVLGIVLGLTGAAMLMLFSQSTVSVDGSSLYASLCVLATMCYAINANNISANLRDQHPAGIASAAFMITGPLFFFGLWWSGGWPAAMSHAEGSTALWCVLYLAAFGTVGGSILYFLLIQRTGPVFGSSVTYLLPVVAMLLGVFDGETIGLVDLAGTGVILTGLYLARK